MRKLDSETKVKLTKTKSASRLAQGHETQVMVDLGKFLDSGGWSVHATLIFFADVRKKRNIISNSLSGLRLLLTLAQS
jgi:hypothetical protein